MRAVAAALVCAVVLLAPAAAQAADPAWPAAAVSEAGAQYPTGLEFAGDGSGLLTWEGYVPGHAPSPKLTGLALRTPLGAWTRGPDVPGVTWGLAHAIYNPGPGPVQWMNLNVSLIPGVYDNFDLGDTRAGATLDAIPTFMTMRLDRSALRPAGARGRGAAAPAPDSKAVLSQRVLGPAVFSTTWSYVDHVLVPPGATTAELLHDSIGEAYYVLAGEGTMSVKGAAAGTAAVRTGDAIPIRLGESTQFTNAGSVPLELFVMGVARDMAAKTQLLTGAPR